MEISNLKHTAINSPNLTPIRAFAAIAVVYFLIEKHCGNWINKKLK